MIRIAIDLELHSDGVKTGSIIQLGYSIFCTKREIVLYTGGDYIKTGKPLSSYITRLTGITEDDIESKGVGLEVAYNNLTSKVYELGKQDRVFSQLVEWGGGDVAQLKKELILDSDSPLSEKEWIFGHSSLNLKALYQFYQISREKKFQGGLGKSLNNLGCDFEPFLDLSSKKGGVVQRGAHDARADALNTARVYLEIQGRIHGGE